jgi:ADP-ribose pyrophosphatase YjhB (NUDIX family)
MTNSVSKKLHLILVNAVVIKGNKVLISQRSSNEVHEPGKWTIPGGKVEKTPGNIWNIVEESLKREVLEETGIKIQNEICLITTNTFIHSTGNHVVALTFLCRYRSGKAKPLEDTIKVNWISLKQIDNYQFAPNVKSYIINGFNYLKNERL